MGWIKRFVYFAVGLGVVLAGVFVTLSNNQPVAVDLYWWQSPSLPFGVLMLLAVLLGAVLGVFACSALLWRHRRATRQLQKQVKQMQTRLDHIG